MVIIIEVKSFHVLAHLEKLFAKGRLGLVFDETCLSLAQHVIVSVSYDGLRFLWMGDLLYSLFNLVPLQTVSIGKEGSVG